MTDTLGFVWVTPDARAGGVATRVQGDPASGRAMMKNVGEVASSEQQQLNTAGGSRVPIEPIHIAMQDAGATKRTGK